METPSSRVDYNVSGLQATGHSTVNFGNFHHHYHDRPSEDAWRAAVAWLFRPDGTLNQSTFQDSKNETKTNGTGVWFTDGSDFAEWAGSSNSFLWLCGDSGSGKSILCSSVIEKLQDSCDADEHSALAYHYITFDDAATQSRDTIVRTVIHQLARSSPDTRQRLQDRHTRAVRRFQESPTQRDLRECLQETTKTLNTAFIILDGLDEVKTHSDMILSFIEELVGWGISSLRLLVASRYLGHMDKRLENRSSNGFRKANVKQVKLNQTLVDPDIVTYVQTKLPEFPEKERPRIQKHLTENSQGSFRYVAALCDLINSEAFMSPNRLDGILRSLPRTLSETYERALSTKSQGNHVLVHKILQFIIASARPLELRELSDAITVDLKNRNLVDTGERLYDWKNVIGRCSPFVTLEGATREESEGKDFSLDTDSSERPGGNSKENARLRLAHFTVKAYLTEEIRCRPAPVASYSIDTSEASFLLAETCLAYAVHVGTQADSDGPSEEKWPFLGYSIQYWHSHAEAAEGLEKSRITHFQDLIDRIRTTSTKIYRRLTYPEPTGPFHPWLPPTDCDEPATPATQGDQICRVCERVNFSGSHDAKPAYRHHTTLDDLRVSAASGCNLCILLYNALIYQWIARNSHLLSVDTASQSATAEKLAWKAMEAVAGSNEVWLHVDASGDPFLVANCFCFFGRLRLYQTSDPDAGFFYPKLLSRGQCMADECVALASNWLSICSEQHSTHYASRQAFIPNRLIDVGVDGRPPRLLPHTRNLVPADRYATMSHCWGSAIPLRATSSNISSLENEIQISSLPAAIADAIHLTRMLGIRYFWLDCLCIVQDDESDRTIYALQIPLIFRNSYLNIVSGGRDSTIGLFHQERKAPRFRSCRIADPRGSTNDNQETAPSFHVGWTGSEAFYDQSGTDLQKYRNSWRYQTTTHRRAWTFQEMRLAPRNIVFQPDEGFLTTAQLYMQCSERIAWENGYTRAKTKVSENTSLGPWYETVEQFSGLLLTFASDKLPALSAIAREYSSVYEGIYLAGLWMDDQVRGLLWYPERPGPRPKGYPITTPTWSWASVSGAVLHYWPADAVQKVTVVEHSRANHDFDGASRDPLGRERPYIKLRGQVLKSNWQDFQLLKHPNIYGIAGHHSNDSGPVLRATCWFDYEGRTPEDKRDGEFPEEVVVLQITQRSALLLQSLEHEDEDQVYERIGLLVTAKSSSEYFSKFKRQTVKVF